MKHSACPNGRSARDGNCQSKAMQIPASHPPTWSCYQSFNWFVVLSSISQDAICTHLSQKFRFLPKPPMPCASALVLIAFQALISWCGRYCHIESAPARLVSHTPQSVILGYVNGINGGLWSPSILRTGGTTTNIVGPMHPMTIE